MEITDLVEETVIHKSFGKGVIQNANEKYLEVFFIECNRWSKFLYPSCFDVFLKLENEKKGNEVAKDVEQWRIDSGENQRKKWKRQYEARERAMRERQSMPEEKKKKASQRAREYRTNQYQRKTENRSILHKEDKDGRE